MNFQPRNRQETFKKWIAEDNPVTSRFRPALT